MESAQTDIKLLPANMEIKTVVGIYTQTTVFIVIFLFYYAIDKMNKIIYIRSRSSQPDNSRTSSGVILALF